jgi:hypothetical protein
MPAHHCKGDNRYHVNCGRSFAKELFSIQNQTKGAPEAYSKGQSKRSGEIHDPIGPLPREGNV